MKHPQRQYVRLDATESAFLNKQLEHVRSKTYDKRYPQLKARRFVPVDSSVDSGADTVTYYQYSHFGTAKLIASYADDLPQAEVEAKKFTTNVYSLGNSYSYDIMDIRRSMKAGIGLPQLKANAARRAFEVKVDEILATGDSVAGLYGLLNQPNALTYTVPNDGTGTSTLWSTKTPDQIVRDMHGIAHWIVTSTKEVEQPNTLLLPLEQYNLAATTRMGDGSNDTILTHFLNTSQYITEVASWDKLDGAGSGPSDRMVAYYKDPDYVQGIIPQEFEQFPPQEINLEYRVPCHGRIGGVVMPYPHSMAYGDGI